MSDVSLIRVGPDDWREFREVRLASLLDAPNAFGSRHADWLDAAPERWRARLTDVPFTVIARADVGPIGVASGVPSDSSVELISMWVAAGHRNTGLTQRLIGAVAAWANGRGQPVSLMVRDDNAIAIQAYLRVGFVDLGVPEDWPADEPPERRMWLGMTDV